MEDAKRIDVSFRVLGRFDVFVEGRAVRVPAGKQRTLLALLLAKNAVVSRSRLIDELWSDDPPEQAVRGLQMHVLRLRRALGPAADRVRTEATGYVLGFDPEEVDAHRFETAVVEARNLLADGAAEAARKNFVAALGMWNGEPYTSVDETPTVNAEIARLSALRVEAEVLRIEAELALGRHETVIPALQALVRSEPLDERFRVQLMLALYRSGRKADALEVYRESRAAFVERLGLEPSEELQRLQRAILQGDPALATPEPRRERKPATDRPKGNNGRRRLGATAAVALAAGAAVAGLLLVNAGNGSSRIEANSVALLDARGAVTSEMVLGSRPVGLAINGGRVWVATNDGHLTQTPVHHGTQVTSLALGGALGALAVEGDSVWVANGDNGELERVDTSTQRVLEHVRVGNGPVAVAAGFDSLWVVNAVDGTLVRIDSRSGRLTATIPVGPQPSAVAVGDAAVWVTDAVSNVLLRIGPATGKVEASIPVGGAPSAVAVTDGTAWVANTSDGTVSRIDLRSNVVSATVPVGKDPDGVAVAGGKVWVASQGDQMLVRIDPRTNRIETRTPLGGTPEGLAANGSQLAIATFAAPAAHRGGTLRLIGSTGGDSISLDPASEYDAIGYSLLATTNDGLVAYRHEGGTAGLQVVPDLARSLPLVTNGGRSYTFQLRAGLRYSDARPLRASDVRASIERLWRLHSPITQIGDLQLGLVGESRCARHPAHCDLSAGIETDDGSGTVTFHLVRPVPSFLRLLALPFYDVLPAGTAASHGRPLPATGPYRFLRYIPGKSLELVRNPLFRMWSSDAQPDGFADQIQWTITDDRDALRAVLAGRADYLVSGVPTAKLASVTTDDAAQVHTNDPPWLYDLFLNTRVPPFNQAPVRRALDLAIDRHRIVDLAGGPLAVAPTCQILPPGFTGYEPWCPYTVDPTSAGTWTDPDLDGARSLLRGTRTSGMRVLVSARSDSDWTGEVAVARYLVGLLDDLGFRASLKLAKKSAYYSFISDSRHKAQIGFTDWIPDLPDASGVFQPLLTCSAFQPHSTGNSNFAEFCSPSIDADIKRAETLEQTDPAGANQWWAVVDRRVGIAAPWVPLYSVRRTDLVSRRVGNFEFNQALGGFLLDQAWVR